EHGQRPQLRVRRQHGAVALPGARRLALAARRQRCGVPAMSPRAPAWLVQRDRLHQRVEGFSRWARETRRSVAPELFDEAGLDTVFQHARNVLSGTVIVAAGLYAAHHLGPSLLPGMWTVHVAGYVVAAMGVVLLLLNLCDGLRRLARRRHHVALRIATIVV